MENGDYIEGNNCQVVLGKGLKKGERREKNNIEGGGRGGDGGVKTSDKWNDCS